MSEPIRRVRSGVLDFVGPARLLESPSDEEIRARIAQVQWQSAGCREFAESQHRLGYIRTRFELEYLCSEPGINDNLNSFALRNGVTVVANPRPRNRRP